ncbi:helix-turn-helix domain-containing protein [Achromobacter sp.]|uniref:helix-turn-helix domain-containing protein n=1 Tax=Achromobacter sp. TaxID=134375 RepID=UPI003C7886FD
MNAPARLAQVAPARAADTLYAMDGWWTLVYQGWTLLTPQGIRIGLTALERTCLLCLAGNSARELRRDEFLTARRRTTMRTLNVAICRLRGKVLLAGVRLPLHTVHGMGYVFLGKLRELSET